MPCSSGYEIFSSPRYSVAAFSPMNSSPSSAPARTRVCFGRPTHDGNTHLGTSSPAKPARIVPEPLSSTMGALWSRSAILLRLRASGHAAVDCAGSTEGAAVRGSLVSHKTRL
jgi:hypothetical protein